MPSFGYDREVMMKRILFNGHRLAVDSQTRSVRLNIYFTTGDGERYVWTPDWQDETRKLFAEVYHTFEEPQSRVEKPVVAGADQVKVEEKVKRDTIDFQTLAYKVGETFKNITTLDQIEKTASDLFDFNPDKHINSNCNNLKSQHIYDWIMTLGKQPKDPEIKSRLLRQFIDGLLPVTCNPAKR
ncbi:hypothetical protein ACFLWG_01830 [Chloroflexota bacterium]